MVKERAETKESQTEKETTIEPFLDMRDPTFRRILRAATSKFDQMICPLMASVCVRDLCMFWNDHTKSCLIVDGLRTYMYHTVCPKCQSTSVQISAKEQRGGKALAYTCDNCGNSWSQVH